MKEFFTYTSPYRTGIYYDLNFFEWFIPILLVIVLAVLIFKYKDLFKHNKELDKKMRISFGIALAVLYSSHYILRFALYGFDTIVIPFQLCSISMFLAVILLFTKNRTLHTYVLMTGVAGGLISLFFPILGYNAMFYRYYQFMIAHGILILTPLYFMAVHDYIPSAKEVRISFYILQGLAIFMIVFNYYMNTDFLFLFIDPAKLDKFPAIALFGGIPYYIFLVEITGMLYFYGFYKVISFIYGRKDYQGKVEYKHT